MLLLGSKNTYFVQCCQLEDGAGLPIRVVPLAIPREVDESTRALRHPPFDPRLLLFSPNLNRLLLDDGMTRRCP
jgi:hypothetical protein